MTSEGHPLNPKSPPNSRSSSDSCAQPFRSGLIPVLTTLALFSRPAFAGAASGTELHLAPLPVQTQDAYGLLKKKAEVIEKENRANGWAYIVSGGIALGVSIPAYYLSDDLFAKVIYTAGETLGIAAVGYGSYLVLIENEYRKFDQSRRSG